MIAWLTLTHPKGFSLNNAPSGKLRLCVVLPVACFHFRRWFPFIEFITLPYNCFFNGWYFFLEYKHHKHRGKLLHLSHHCTFITWNIFAGLAGWINEWMEMCRSCFKGICCKEPSHWRKSEKGSILAGSWRISKTYPGKVRKNISGTGNCLGNDQTPGNSYVLSSVWPKHRAVV